MVIGSRSKGPVFEYCRMNTLGGKSCRNIVAAIKDRQAVIAPTGANDDDGRQPRRATLCWVKSKRWNGHLAQGLSTSCSGNSLLLYRQRSIARGQSGVKRPNRLGL